MTKKVFMNRIAHGHADILQQFLDLLEEMKIDYCVIGGLAVNAYAEPVVSLDLGLIVAADNVEKLITAAEKKFTVKRLSRSVILESQQSDLRIQLQTDPRYQSFISNATGKNVLDYTLKVAAVEDVLRGKIWAYADEQRRKSKRQKDLADIFRLVEAYPYLTDLLPVSIKAMGI